MSLPRVVQAIRRHRRFLVAAHVNPEADALGSALGLAGLLRKLGKRVQILNDGGTPESLRFLPGSDRVAATLPGPTDAEVAITVDVPVFARVGASAKWLKQAGQLISIDHHVSHDRFGDINWVDPAAAATGQMIYRLFRAFRIAPSKDDALCLYAALVIDTGSFKYRNTTPEVHRIAADLLERARISPLVVSQQLYETHHLRGLRTLGVVLRRLQATPDGRVAWVEVPRRLVRQAGPEILDELVNYPRAIKTAEVAFAMREHGPRNVRISLRSKGRVDVDRIARAFGGGGHLAASGCTIRGSLSSARRALLAEIRTHLPSVPSHGRPARR
ncbi:MAG: bifunctional oligoribonuclease/PAP phosphatase NrnA [Candidatus Omnitrophica bacterium]|nr:bifunctional oligoribonuclease/PAP phosphatase NrnA [Candidatus Omnitrophota bacterium]